MVPNKPILQLVIEPESKHRFRYANSDIGSHGVISGKKGRKTYPTVKLLNYRGSSSDIIIRVTLCTEKRTDHVHQFKQKKSSGHKSYIERTLNNDFCAVFEDLSIIIPGNKNKGHEILMNRKIENLGKDLSESDREEFEKEHIKEVKKEYKDILHSAVLRFDAFEKGKICDPICEPLYSDTISNDRAPCNNNLKICDMSKYSGSWKGGDDIILLCEKIQKKNVKIKFFETDMNQIVWEAYASIDLSDIHHQFAIKFKTPPYKANIEKTVAVCLEQENEISEPQDFTYKPEEDPCNSELKICHMSKVFGSWKGDEDVIILCEKLQEDEVKIKFFETNGNEITWEAYASFSISDIHHQVAIKFKTPPYKENIEKEVYVCLEQGDKRSTPRCFTYIPEGSPSKRTKWASGETVISEPMDIASSSCTSDDKTLREEPEELFASLEEILKSDGDVSNSFIMQDLEAPSSVLDPESLKNFKINSLMNFLLSDSEDDSMKQPVTELEEQAVTELKEQAVNEFEEQVVNQSYQFIPNVDIMDGVMIDLGKLAGKMALISTEDSAYSAEIPKEVSKKESKDKMLEDKHKKFEKYLPFLSNRDSNGNSLLHLAVLYNKSVKNVFSMIKMSKSNIINAKNNNEQTALHIAVENNYDVVTDLLENFADPSIKNADGDNCYHIACHHDLDKSLMYMSREGHCNAVGLNDFNNEGLTPVHVALRNYSPACLDFLLKECRHLIDFSLVESNLGKSFLHYAVEYSPTYVLPLLKEKIFDINKEDFEGKTPLLLAHMKGNYNVVKQLLSAGATYKKINSKYIRHDKLASLKEMEASVRQIPVSQANFNEASKGPPDFNCSNEDKESTRIFEELTKNLSVLLDPDMKWEKLATYVIDEKYFSSLVECSRSPTRTILEYMKKTLGAQYIEQLIAVLNLIGFSDAVTITMAYVIP